MTKNSKKWDKIQVKTPMKWVTDTDDGLLDIDKINNNSISLL